MEKEKSIKVDWKSKTDLLNQVLDLQVEVYGQKEIEILSRLIDTHKIKTMIDVGCHNGGFTKALAVHHPNVRFLGVDFDEQKIREAHEKNKLSNIQFQVCDVMNCPADVFAGADGIMERFTVQHLDAQRYIAKVCEQTKGKAK